MKIAWGRFFQDMLIVLLLPVWVVPVMLYVFLSLCYFGFIELYGEEKDKPK